MINVSFNFSRKQFLLLVLSLSLIGAGVYYSYLLLFKPIQMNIENLQIKIEQEQKALQLLKQKQSDEKTPVINSKKLQQKIPVLPLTEQLILQFERAETLSGSDITEMVFSEKDFDRTQLDSISSAEQTEEDGSSDANLQNDSSKSEKATDDDSTKQSLAKQLPEGLKQIEATLTVEAENYFELEEFIDTIEHQTRITKVDGLILTGFKEKTAATNTVEPLIYTVTVSSYYMPTFTDLINDAPKINIPAPSHKTNPFAQ